MTVGPAWGGAICCWTSTDSQLGTATESILSAMLVVALQSDCYLRAGCFACVHALASAWCPWESEEGTRSSEVEFKMAVGHHVGAGN